MGLLPLFFEIMLEEGGIFDHVFRHGLENISFVKRHDCQDKQDCPCNTHDDGHDEMEDVETGQVKNITKLAEHSDPAN